MNTPADRIVELEAQVAAITRQLASMPVREPDSNFSQALSFYTAIPSSPISAGSASNPTMGTASIYALSVDGSGNVIATLLTGTKQIANPFPSEMPAGASYTATRVGGESYTIVGPDVMRILANYPGFGELTVPFMPKDATDIEQMQWGGDQCPPTLSESDTDNQDHVISTAWTPIGLSVTAPRAIAAGEFSFVTASFTGSNSANQDGTIAIGWGVNGTTPAEGSYATQSIDPNYSGRKGTTLMTKNLTAAQGDTIDIQVREEFGSGGFAFTVQGTVNPSTMEFGTN